jgi:hypothetical protein
MSISALSSSAEKERSWQLGPGYIHIVDSHHRRGWLRWLTKVRTHQPSLLQLLDNLTQGFEVVDVPSSHTIPPAGLRGGTVTRQHRERRISSVPQKKPFSLPSNRRVGHREAEVRVNSLLGSDGDIHIDPHRRFRA